MFVHLFKSCTAHPPQGIPSFWVDTAERIDVAQNKILHKLAHGELKETTNWLPEGPVRIGGCPLLLFALVVRVFLICVVPGVSVMSHLWLRPRFACMEPMHAFHVPGEWWNR